jgi:hypothetical protein
MICLPVSSLAKAGDFPLTARCMQESCASHLEEHAAELAEHFSFSSDTSDLAKAVDYARLVAKRAADGLRTGKRRDS